MVDLDVFGSRMSAIAQINKCFLGPVTRQDFQLLQRFVQRMPIIRVARQAAHADHQSFLVRGRHRDFDAKLVRLPRFAFADAFHLGRM